MTRAPSEVRTFNQPFGFGASVGTVLARNRGMGPGFDLLRIALATLIFIGHAKWISGGQGLFDGVLPGPPTDSLPGAIHWPGMGRIKIVLLPMFFALSGILIMGSAARIRAPSTFIMHRILRIFPALVVEIALSALILGPLMTTLPVGDYFHDSRFLEYWGNCLGIVTFRLPGLFASNPVPDVVNQNLWTLPSELDCYLIALALMATGLLFKRTSLSVVFALVTLGLIVHGALAGVVVSQGLYDPHILTYYFFAGILAYQWRDRIPARLDLALLCAVIGVVTVMFDAMTYVSPLFITLTVLFIGLIPFPRVPVLSGGDYSYGIYLYGFPISQAIIALHPGFRGHPALLALVAGAITLLFAMMSWHAVEKKILGLRRALPESWFPTRPRDRSAVPASH